LTGLLQGLAREHAVLLSEHDLDFVVAVADWRTVMAEGTVLAEGKPATIRANTAVQEAYLGGHA
jgi:branched-chain amino acid transport system ATP-binding protein